MPFSYDFFNDQVQAFVNGLAPARVLDVGPGAGKYGRLLKQPGRTIHASEVFAPYIAEYRLEELYDHVFNLNVLDFAFSYKEYDLVVMGDILEHLTVPEAQRLLETLRVNGIPALVLVPYNYRQGKCHDNDHEEHKQPDLTEALFHERYPGFTKILGNNKQGVFYRA